LSVLPLQVETPKMLLPPSGFEFGAVAVFPPPPT
jgi:hypothetical protein